VITVTDIPTGETLTCAQPSITLTASGADSYAWNNGSNNAEITVTNPGTYTVTGTANGCSNIQTLTIGVDKTPPVAVITKNPNTDMLTCTVSTIRLTATGGKTYDWNDGLSSNNYIDVTTKGEYSITVTADNGCTDKKSVTIGEDEGKPVISITTNPGTTTLTCTTPVITLTASGGKTYLWSTGSTETSITVTEAGNYSVDGTADDGNGCTGTGKITITADKDSPKVAVNGAKICEGDNATLTATGAKEYTWTPSQGLNSATGAIVTANPETSTTYTVEGTAENGCKTKATAFVYVEAPLILTLDAPESVELGNEITIRVESQGPAHGAYEWFINDEPYRTISESYITLEPAAGKQHFRVETRTTDLNCFALSESYLVNVSENIPNIITPYNPDSPNCCFMMAKGNRPGYHVEIYNRDMQKVFEGDNGWNGTYRGSLAEPGTYFYRIFKKDGKIEKGTLEVVKF
jgi:hypothetical protein